MSEYEVDCNVDQLDHSDELQLDREELDGYQDYNVDHAGYLALEPDDMYQCLVQESGDMFQCLGLEMDDMYQYLVQLDLDYSVDRAE
jgi:hypothetical protein